MSANAILVTGGAGYVGAHTCKALSRGGYLPVVIDNLSTGHESFVRWGPLIKADIRDTDAVANAINTFDPEEVVIGGGGARAGSLLLDPATRVARSYVLPGLGNRTTIRLARHGVHAGLLGAALLARDEIQALRAQRTAASDEWLSAETQ